MRAPAVNAQAQSDAELIARSRLDPEAFSAIFYRHFAAIHRYLARRVGKDRADDLAAQTFATAFARRRGFDQAASSARPWLFGIATNLMRNDLRAERRLLEAAARLAASPGGPLADEVERLLARADAAINMAQIAGALAALDSDQRDVLLLHAWGELSDQEIAQSLAIPVGTVYSRLSRARAVLRRALPGPPATETCSAKEKSR